MKGLVFLGEGKMEFREYADPTPGPDEVIVRMKASGMCGSDLNHLNEPKRREDQIVIEGHEPCGVIAEVGSAVRSSEAKVGDRVMVYHYDGCRTCTNCRSGWMQNCDHDRIAFGGNGHGAHAQFMKVPAHTIIKLPDELSFKAGAAVGCGSGTAYAALKRINLAADETIAVFGQGPVGLSCTMFAKAFGARVIALDVGEERLQMARDFGADFAINPLKDDPVEAIRDLTRGGLGVEKAVECSSNPIARQQAMKVVRQWGTTCLVGVHGAMEFECNELITKQKSLVGSLTFSKNIQDECAQFVAERGINVDALFTHEFSLDQAAEAYELFEQRKIGKGVFIFD
ncbi:zinc-dependent alcohol dehydrogenase family protein (plasmid) [Rhizobium leguminosarum]|jgi:D-arabinose 1-dehydrogenase-like Zn-dependent alcohol dehydrogenase|uniref:Iditol 2-dehydrogenase n=2 Tax=Rhizobium leguminosarum TaxID=384 RepID=A0A1B8RCT0_RHILT|nr:zinc-binding dehydrogenase [Rhizobium leguminosarum]AOO90575.1 iditol 2-dehydrogenase [Rhizobium leguminosarum bv. trifolii]MBP2490767.1 D-arabinose 1-dehydrogenase-like Zn-dependent alcohol dehydrogenase [Rhizobium leguminosarum]MBY5474406.1 zinc-binding dehydrogenase [Rhizobium leguminosarum]MBY5496059.1 zinc-binding dehydrogenase [Rhizobium leguminosarum]MBY5509929.1 zinc-binding dehydrogenase [Rhizobium leguminosarum]